MPRTPEATYRARTPLGDLQFGVVGDKLSTGKRQLGVFVAAGLSAPLLGGD